MTTVLCLVFCNRQRLGDDKINAAWSNFMNSGVAVEYFEKDTSAVNRIDLMGAKERPFL